MVDTSFSRRWGTALLVELIAATAVLCVAAVVVQAHAGNAPVERPSSVEVLR